MEVEYNNLDDDWINEFDKIDKIYKDFYKDDIYYVNLKVVYINRNNEIDKLKFETFLMREVNIISREEILQILKKHTIDDNRTYSLLSLLKYNIILEPDDVKNYLKNGENLQYLTVIKNIDAIKFEKSISMLQDLNDLILIFYEKSNEIKKVNVNNSTKKIYIRSLSNNKKTIKKRYED